MARFYNLKNTLINIRKYSKCIHENDVYILSGVRTPIGCFLGKLAKVDSVQLGVTALTAAVERACIHKNDVPEFIMGHYYIAGTGQFPTHQVALRSGLSPSVITSTVAKACASGMKAVMYACLLIMGRSQEIVAVGGTESLSNVPYILRRQNSSIGDITVSDLLFCDGLNDPTDNVDVSAFAEETAKEYHCTREQQDAYALRSYTKAALAQKNGVFKKQIVPVVVKKKKKGNTKGAEETICEDEQIGRKPENFEKLKPIAGKEGTITAGNASGFNDGAAMLILASGNYVMKKNLNPLARIVSFADACLEPRKFCVAPSIAIPKALLKAKLNKDDIAKWEISETFALTALVNAQILKIELDRLNLHGGAVSLGHPFGMTGARLVVHLAHVLFSGELGCAAISHGCGGASAMIIEKL